jgi:hypothetical protein
MAMISGQGDIFDSLLLLPRQPEGRCRNGGCQFANMLYHQAAYRLLKGKRSIKVRCTQHFEDFEDLFNMDQSHSPMPVRDENQPCESNRRSNKLRSDRWRQLSDGKDLMPEPSESRESRRFVELCRNSHGPSRRQPHHLHDSNTRSRV